MPENHSPSSRPPDSRRLLVGSVLLITLFTLGLAAGWAWYAYQGYRSAALISAANQTVDRIIFAAALRAAERGLTAAALGADRPISPPILEEIIAARREGDAVWQRAHDEARLLLDELPADNEHLARAVARAAAAYDVLSQTRARVDDDLGKGGEAVAVREWISNANGFIVESSQLWDAILSAVAMPKELAELDYSLKRRLFLASENAGRERGTFAYYISARRPVPPELLQELMYYRGVVEQNLAEITLLDRGEIAMDPQVHRAIGGMEDRFAKHFDAIRSMAYAGAQRGVYATTGAQWLQEATAAIDSILNVTATITAVSAGYARQAIRRSAWNLAWALGVMSLTTLLATLNLARARRTANDLFHQKELAEVTLHSIGDAVITTDAAARVEYLNPVAEQITGWSSGEAHGRPLQEVFKIMNNYTREPQPNPVEVCLRESRVVGLENGTVLIRPNGQEIQIEDSAAPIRDRKGNIVGAVMVFYDLSSSTQAAHLMSYHASHDALTRLVNRREFERRLVELLIRAKNSGERHALCYLDIDQFKAVNDTCGHKAGDKLLSQLAFVLRGQIRETDTLARLGGDEFGLLLEGCSMERATLIAEQLRQAVRGFRFTWEDKPFELGVSVGLVPINEHSACPAETLSDADAACLAAKKQGRNAVHVYQPGVVELAQRHSENDWVPRIRKALAEDGFRLVGQAIAPLSIRAPAHCEVLLRMLDTDGGLIEPMAFIPAAERYGLMEEIDRWVVRHALALLGRHVLIRAEPPPVCNINVSGASLAHKEFARYILDQVAAHELPPGLLCFEITETTAVSNFEETLEFIGTLRPSGCQFALDDFGRGLSSFSYLKNLPVDYLKIDGDLIRDIADDSVSLSMVQAIHRVGRILGLKIVAEYVGNAAILEKVRALDIDYAQGHAIGAPYPLTDGLLCGGAVSL